ncbi:MAG TPA: AsmA family protein [Stellaceae bacterium]|nr:AsmA family protein [Stellaceae bacterium]
MRGLRGTGRFAKGAGTFLFVRHPLLTLTAIAVPVLALTWNWDWFRPLVEARATIAMGRPVHLARFDVKDLFSREPEIVADGITIGNPPEFPEGSHIGTIDRLSVRVDASAALASYGDNIVLTEVALDHPVGDLRRGPHGTGNWVFNSGGSSSEPPHIGALAISDGTVHIVDPQHKSDFRVTIHTQDRTHGNEPVIVADARGTYAGAPITAEFVGGSLLSLRDPKKPYPVDFHAANGATHIALKGTIEDPMHLKGANLALDLAGDNLGDLYKILGVPLAPTPPYHLTGKLDYAAGKIRFRDFAGTVGSSDLEGDFAVEPGHDRPRITADLTSRRVAMADLGGFIGSAPGKAQAADESSEQRQEHAQQAASPRLLPDTPINLPELRAADFKVHYKAQQIDSGGLPLDNLEANLTIEDGNIALHPLSFGVGTGQISSDIDLRPDKNLVRAKASVDFRHVDLHRIMETTKFQGAGIIDGSATIESVGNSLGGLLADGNGGLQVSMSNGTISPLLVDLAGLDFGSAAKSALTQAGETPIRCMVGDFTLQNGLLQTRNLMVNTNEGNIVGTGAVNLKNEAVDFQIKQQPKHFSIGALHAPIEITGTLKHPDVGLDKGQLAGRAGAAAVLGVLATPLGALLPTVQLGIGASDSCTQAPGAPADNDTMAKSGQPPVLNR